MFVSSDIHRHKDSSDVEPKVVEPATRPQWQCEIENVYRLTPMLRGMERMTKALA